VGETADLCIPGGSALLRGASDARLCGVQGAVVDLDEHDGGGVRVGVRSQLQLLGRAAQLRDQVLLPCRLNGEPLDWV
jgi:hypothetical protein